MKKIYLFLAIFGGLTLSSCNLDEEPSVSLPVDETITSASDLRNAVNGIGYILSEQRMTYPSEFGLYGDLTTNVFAIAKDNGQSSPISQYTLTANDALNESAYCYFYKAIANDNLALKESANLATGDDSATVVNLWGQLYAWRGLMHFDLARMFAHIPSTVSDVNAANSGIVLSTEVYPDNYKGTRSTLKKTYEQIINDFTKGMSYMSKTAKKETGYFNYYAALALRARAYLYNGDYAKALEDAQEVIADGGYKLYTADSYASVWDKTGTDESIFEFLVTDNYNPQRNAVGYYTDASGYPECAFNTNSKLYKYLKAAQADTSDVRCLMIKTGAVSKINYDFPAKYPGRDGSLYVNNPKIIRLSEVYLIAAEAELKLGDASAAATYINAIEANRVTKYKDVATVTLDDILFEYEKELFEENQIAFAYWRNKQSVTNMVNKVITYDSYQNILQIPQREIDYNPAIVQNPKN